MSIMSGASTYALGNVVLELMERGVGLENFDVDLAKDIYEENLEKGKKVAEELQKQYKERTASATASAPLDSFFLLISRSRFNRRALSSAAFKKESSASS